VAAGSAVVSISVFVEAVVRCANNSSINICNNIDIRNRNHKIVPFNRQFYLPAIFLKASTSPIFICLTDVSLI
jgi:hypothetical protein